MQRIQLAEFELHWEIHHCSNTWLTDESQIETMLWKNIWGAKNRSGLDMAIIMFPLQLAPLLDSYYSCRTTSPPPHHRESGFDGIDICSALIHLECWYIDLFFPSAPSCYGIEAATLSTHILKTDLEKFKLKEW